MISPRCFRQACFLACIAFAAAPCCEAAERVELILRNGVVYDGSGAAPIRGDIGVRAGRVAAVGDLSDYEAAREIDVEGLAVAPGFINMLSQAMETLLHDGRGMSD